MIYNENGGRLHNTGGKRRFYDMLKEIWTLCDTRPVLPTEVESEYAELIEVINGSVKMFIRNMKSIESVPGQWAVYYFLASFRHAHGQSWNHQL